MLHVIYSHWNSSRANLELLCATMSWVLIEEGSRAWSIVHEKNVLRAGSKLTIGQAYKFFYQGNPYKGTVLALDGKLLDKLPPRIAISIISFRRLIICWVMSL